MNWERTGKAPWVCEGAVGSDRRPLWGRMLLVVGVVCLAFPLHPPGKPEASRVAELASVTGPV